MNRTLIFAAFLCLNTPAFAQNLVFVEGLEHCAGFIDDHMTFDGKNFTETEYSCTMSESVSRSDMNSSDMLVRVGYCEDPDSVYPTVFVLRWEKSDMDNDPGVLYVWEGSEGAPRLYYDCQS